MLLRFILIGLLTCSINSIVGQSNTVSTGGNASGSNGNVSYTIGQLDYSSQNTAGGNINQGVQQPYEIFEMNALNENQLNIGLTIAPNPTSDQLTLTASDLPKEVLYVELVDLNGKAIIHKVQLQETNTFDLSELSTGSYLLIVSDSKTTLKSYKILKNN